MFQTTINATALRQFQADLHGELICPGDEGYDSARKVWNGMIEKYPALIARCADVSDVTKAIQFARRHSLPAAVRGGGHSFAGYGTCDDGIVIDLSRMKGVQVDPVRRTAWVQAGVTLGELISQTQTYGLVTPVGTVSETGLAGLTLGGGFGWLMGKYGLTIDNLLSAQIVTAQGHVLTVNSDEHADLFWGVRGGGGNFGVVTAFEFRLHQVGPLLAGMVLHPMERASEVLDFYHQFSCTTPDELSTAAGMLTTPDGLPVVALALCYCGSLEEGERVIEPIKHYGSPLVDLTRPMSYLEVISLFNATAPAGRHYYSKAHSLKALDDELFKLIIEAGSALPSPWTQVILQHVHGAASRVGPTETAFALRDEYYDLQLMTSWNEEMASRADASIHWVRGLWEQTKPFAAEGTYINFLSGDEGASSVRASYGVNYERLVALKNTYDPTNFFHLNHNIKPTTQQ